MSNGKNRYVQLIEKIFEHHYSKSSTEVFFERNDLIRTAKELGIELPKNLGDVVYSFRYRVNLPESIRRLAPKGQEWVIRPAGTARYKFSLTSLPRISPNEILAETKIPDATPGIILMYALSDEQALLAKVRYNRLVDIFTGVTCYSLQSHLRTTVADIGQLETDELYIGVDQRGAQYVFPVQAKGGRDRLGIVQIEQDFAMCISKFPSLICRPISTQFMEDNLIALFAFEEDKKKGIVVAAEKHYRLVLPEDMSEEDLENYRKSPF